MSRLKLTQEGVVFLLTAALFVLFAATLHNFLTPGNMVALIRSVAILGILGLGMGLVVIGRGIDLAMVATMVVSVSWVLSLAQASFSLPVALLLGLTFALAVGLASGLLVAYATIPAIFATLAIGLIVYGMGRAWLFQVDVQNTPAQSSFFTSLSEVTVLGIPMMIIAFGLLSAIIWSLLKWTQFGRMIYAIGDNPTAARTSGIAIRPLIVAQYVIASAVSFLAGLVMAAANSGMSTRVYN
jgi:ribose transport system permease protein